jgi:hypothetical protein
MDAIRQSDDRYRTLESFWKGQINSKVWLIEQLKKLPRAHSMDILICGGWYGVMATLLFNSDLYVNRITSMDIDSKCENTANTMNKQYEISGRFRAVTQDMLTYKDYDRYDLIINTVCEHLTQEQYNTWLKLIPEDKIIVLQSNDYVIAEHVSPMKDLKQFVTHSKLYSIVEPSELQTEKYKRFMIIGKKNGSHN